MDSTKLTEELLDLNNATSNDQEFGRKVRELIRQFVNEQSDILSYQDANE